MNYRASGYHVPLPVDSDRALAFPVTRFLARSLDLLLYTLLWTAFQYLLLRWHTMGGALDSLLTSYASLALMIFVEPLLLSTLGTTPGKAILGLALRHEDGSRLSYGEGLARTFGVFAGGYGYGARVRLAGFEPGLYVLKVEARSRLVSSEPVVRQVLFRVVG